MSNLAENVKRLRKAKKLSQLELIEKSGVTSVKRIESGDIQSPHFGNLESLASALGVTISDLFADPSHQSKPTRRPARRTSIRTKLAGASE